MGYSYDAGGPRTAISYSLGTVAPGYDQDNNLTSVANPFGESTGYAFGLAEGLNTITLANGSVFSMRRAEPDRPIAAGSAGNIVGITRTVACARRAEGADCGAVQPAPSELLTRDSTVRGS